MFINDRDLAGIQQCHLGHSGGAGARADCTALQAEGVWNPHSSPWNDKGCLNLAPTVPTGNRDESSKSCDCQWQKISSSRGGMTKMYTKRKKVSCQGCSPCLPIWDVCSFAVWQPGWGTGNGSACLSVAAGSWECWAWGLRDSGAHWGTEELCLTHCDSVLLWDCSNAVYRASFFFMNMEKTRYSLPKTLHRYSDVFNHSFPHTTQNNKHILSIALTSEFVSSTVFPHIIVWYGICDLSILPYSEDSKE